MPPLLPWVPGGVALLIPVEDAGSEPDWGATNNSEREVEVTLFAPT